MGYTLLPHAIVLASLCLGLCEAPPVTGTYICHFVVLPGVTESRPILQGRNQSSRSVNLLRDGDSELSPNSTVHICHPLSQGFSHPHLA